MFIQVIKSKNDFFVTSSFRTANQLSWSVSISSLSSDLVSGSSFAIHASLSKTTGAGSVGGFEGFVLDVLGLDLGAPKKDVMLPLDLGFFASAAARSTALRFRGVDAIGPVVVDPGWSSSTFSFDSSGMISVWKETSTNGDNLTRLDRRHPRLSRLHRESTCFPQNGKSKSGGEWSHDLRTSS